MQEIELSIESGLSDKYAALRAELGRRLGDGLVVAFSGGVDSTFLLWAAEQERKTSGGRLLALTTQSASFSAAERLDVETFINSYGIPHEWQVSNELLDPRYSVNDRSRCFYCKTELFRICGELARERDLKWIAYGYNASDTSDFRPGHLAAVENSILSPLADAGLTKDDIRSLMKGFGLEMADKPASPCLSSRLVTGVAITSQKLKDVEELESMLRDKGLRVFRVRLHESSGSKLARLEVAPDEMDLALKFRAMFCEAARERGFRWATLDLAGYQTGGGNVSSP
jgi:uncharacterized protein